MGKNRMGAFGGMTLFIPSLNLDEWRAAAEDASEHERLLIRAQAQLSETLAARGKSSP
jgi:hypothetical protein